MKTKEFWFFLFFLGLLLFNWPFLDIFNMALPLYFLIAWGLYIAVVGFVASFSLKKDRDRGV